MRSAARELSLKCFVTHVKLNTSGTQLLPHAQQLTQGTCCSSPPALSPHCMHCLMLLWSSTVSDTSVSPL